MRVTVKEAMTPQAISVHEGTMSKDIAEALITHGISAVPRPNARRPGPRRAGSACPGRFRSHDAPADIPPHHRVTDLRPAARVLAPITRITVVVYDAAPATRQAPGPNVLTSAGNPVQL